MIIEGKIVNNDGQQYGQIQINPISGLIDKVGANLGIADLKTGGLIFPGFIDLHVHARQDVTGRENYKEDFTTAGLAAIHGGVTMVWDMPNNPSPPVDRKSFIAKSMMRMQTQGPSVNFEFYVAIKKGTKPIVPPPKVAYKVFTAPSVGDLFLDTKKSLEEALKNYRGECVSFHCEDPVVLKAHESEPTHETRRPRQAEIKAIETALELIKKYELQGKICHISTKEGLELIKNAKRNGISVTCEATPHHLYFDESMLNEKNRKRLQVNPPLRTKNDRMALIAGLKAGDIDYLASDHAPHTMEEKERGISGMPHLDTYGAFVTWLMGEQGFTPQEIARVCSSNPGNFVNNFWEGKFGMIAPGYLAALTILDQNRLWTVKKEDLKTKCGWSPFEGVTFPGRVSHTIVAGHIQTI